MKTPLLGASLVLAAIFGAAPQTNHAAEAFVLDPLQSEITLEGTLAGSSAGEQGPGSLTTKLAGTLMVEATPTTIHFPGGSTLDAAENGTWEPDVGGASGSAPADFAGQASLPIGTGLAAVRDVVMDATTAQALSLTGDQFEAADIQFVFPTGGNAALDYRISTFLGSQSGREVLEGITTNEVATTGSLVEAGGLLTLTIPLNATYLFELLSPGDSTLSVQGQLVATRSAGTPELTLGTVTIQDGQLNFSWSSQAGQTFTIIKSIDLGTWETVEQDYPAGPGDVTTWSAPIGTGTAFFVIKR
jgi:hypothetical protein